MDETDSNIQMKIIVTSNTSEVENEKEEVEEIVEETRTLNVESIPPTQRVALAQSLLRCLPQRDNVVWRILTTVFVVGLIVLFEVIITSDYNTLKAITQSIISTITSNETTSAAD